MLISDLELLNHIDVELRFVLSNTAGKSQDEVINDEILIRAVVRSIEIIGEATKRISEDFRLSHPYIEWKKMAGTRDRLIHHYFGIDYEIIWDIITIKLPDLQFYIKRILSENSTQ